MELRKLRNYYNKNSVNNMKKISEELEQDIKNDVLENEERACMDLILSIRNLREMGVLSLQQINFALKEGLGNDYQFLPYGE